MAILCLAQGQRDVLQRRKRISDEKLLTPHIRLTDCRVRKSKQATYNIEKRLVKKEYVNRNRVT
mgnify:CR=1 FL=1